MIALRLALMGPVCGLSNPTRRRLFWRYCGEPFCFVGWALTPEVGASQLKPAPLSMELAVEVWTRVAKGVTRVLEGGYPLRAPSASPGQLPTTHRERRPYLVDVLATCVSDNRLKP